MWCAWVRNINDVRGNPTYKWDEMGLSVCNFWYMMAKDEKPFVFLASSTSSTNVLHGWRTKSFMENGGPKGILIISHHDEYLCYFEWHWWWCAMSKHTHDTPTNATRCNPCGCQGTIDKRINYYQSSTCSCNYKHYRCISLKTSMYIRYKYFYKVYGEL